MWASPAWLRVCEPCYLRHCDSRANVRDTDATDGTELLGLQDVLRRMESELSQLRMAAWTQHKAQTQIQSMRFRTKAERAAVSVVLSNLHFKVCLCHGRTICRGTVGLCTAQL